MRGLSVLALLSIVLGAILDARVACRPAPPPLERAHLKAALQVMNAERAPEDVVTHSPLFGPAELATLGELGATPTPARGRRQWVLDDARQPMFVPGELRQRRRFGDVELRLLDAGRTESGPEYDLRRDLRADTLRVENARGDVVSRCSVPRSPEGFQCPGQPEWVYAAPTELVIDGAPRKCVWAHPRTDLTLVFELPPPPGPRRMKLGAGLSDRAAQMANGAPVDVEIQQGQVLDQLRVRNRRGWNEKTVPVAGGQAIELRIETSFDGMRHLCIDVRFETPAEAGGAS